MYILLGCVYSYITYKETWEIKDWWVTVMKGFGKKIRDMSRNVEESFDFIFEKFYEMSPNFT